MPSIFDSTRFNEALFFPRPDATRPPQGAEDLYIEVPEGSLHVRLHPHARTRATLLLFHGNGDVASDYDEAAPFFEAHGAALAVADYRGYGLSQGHPTYRHMLEDAHSIAKEVAQRTSAPLVIMGSSLGCACVAELYADPPEGVTGAVWTSGYTDLRALIGRRGMRVPDAISAEDQADFDPLLKLRRGTLPFLAIHGAEDEVIDPEESRAAFEAAGTTAKQLVFLPDRGHNDVLASAAFWKALQDFLR